MIAEYFIAHGYGKDDFTEDELRTSFRELDAIASLFPKDGEESLLKSYSQFRESYQVYWFKKWIVQ